MGVFAWKDGLKARPTEYNRFVAALPRGRNYSIINRNNFSPSDTIVRDVCIIGGGVTGTFSAIRLRDRGKSVAVIEQKDRLGGHTITYQDPITGLKTEAGVVVIRNPAIAHEYFARFNIPLVKFDPPTPDATLFVDFTTGKKVDFTPSDPTKAFAAYAAQLTKYPFLDNGFDLPDPVPADLLLPFGEFVEKYNLSPMVLIVSKLGQGLGSLLSQPTLYVMKNFGVTALDGMAKGFLATANGDNSELYVKAFAELGGDALLNSSILSTWRERNFVKVLVQTPSGQKLIEAKKLLVTVPPKLDNLQGFDLDIKEQSIFGQFSNSGYYTFILRNTGIPDNHCLINMAMNTRENLPDLPGVYEITPTGVPNLVNLKYGSPVALPDNQVEADVMASLARLRKAGTFETGIPEIALYSTHTPFELIVPVSAIANGFYTKLNALNGHRSTFYTRAAFQAHDASLLCEYTDTIMNKISGY
jgi:hypothetical protein